MTAPEPDITEIFRATVAERPTFAAMALTALADRDAEIARLRRLIAVQNVWLRVWDAHRRLPMPRPALTPRDVDQITATVIAALTGDTGQE